MMDTLLLIAVGWGFFMGFLGGLTAGCWAFRPRPFKPLEFERARGVRARGVVYEADER
jgi:hypothetical protein